MYFYYRISDKSYFKEKLPGIGKKECLENFLDVFYEGSINPEGGVILCDNCQPDTITMVTELAHQYYENKKNNPPPDYYSPLKELGTIQVETSSLGNAGALMWCIDHAIENLSEYEDVYLVEDDYLHRDKARHLLWRGLSLAKNISYATVYDHPDKYTELYNYGETSKVYKKDGRYWRQTQSTTMTFATHVSELKLHYDIWKKYTSSDHPYDHQIFTEIAKNSNEYQGKLVCSIPGYSMHTDLTPYLSIPDFDLDEWVLEISCNALEKQAKSMIKSDGDQDVYDTILGKTKPGTWARIKLLNSFVLAD